MIHIVFQKNDIEALQAAIALDPALQGEIIQIKDDFAVGPIKEIFTPAGIETRKSWWREILADGDYQGIVEDGSVADDNKTVALLKERLAAEADEQTWIWVAQNKHDLSGYYWLVSQLTPFAGRVLVLHLNNLPFINEKGNIFYPVNLFHIPAKEFIKAKKLARPVTASEFEIDPDEWTRLANEEKGVRILDGAKKLVQYDYDFYDASLKKYISLNWQTGQKVIGNFLHKAPQITGDAYLLWRLKGILSNGDYDIQGSVKKMKDFEIKLKQGQLEGEAQPAQA